MPPTLPLSDDVALTGHGAAWLPREGALVVADVHVGYARAGRRRGGYLPAGESAESAARRALDAARAVGAVHVVVAGDLRHSTRDADAAEHAEVRAFLGELAAHVRVTLVPGNHDRGATAYRDTGAAVVEGALLLGDVAVVHEPPAAPPARWTVCGHLHPVAVVRDPTGASARFPCALVGGRVVVLPAFGAWAGGVPAVRLRHALFEADWRSYPMAGGEVYPPAGRDG